MARRFVFAKDSAFSFVSSTQTRREIINLALPGHQFKVIALDGNPVPKPATVDVLQLVVAERVDAIVEMNQPGVWILGATRDHDRNKGLGVVIERPCSDHTCRNARSKRFTRLSTSAPIS